MDEIFRGNKDSRRSPLQHLLKSNAAPSDSEVIVIRALISGAEVSIEELRCRFPTHDHASQVIESQLLETIEAHRVLLSPVRYLPSEILQEIFLHYADDRGPNVTITTIPWRLGHISHRWRKFALSLPSLWDNIPKIYLSEAGSEGVCLRALICLLRRSGTSPTLKLNISRQSSAFQSLKKRYESSTSIIKEIILHSERIERLWIGVNRTTMPLLQGIKGRLPNLRILGVLYDDPDPNIDVFETAPALRQVTIVGRTYQNNGVRVLLPWSQITHYEENLRGDRVGKFVSFSSSPLHSLTNLDIARTWYDESALHSPYRPTTLPNLRTMRIVIYQYNYKDANLFLESLTIPAVEVIKIGYTGPLISQLVFWISWAFSVAEACFSHYPTSNG